MLNKTAHIGHITCLHFINDKRLLVGSGPYLKLYDVDQGIVLDELHCFEHARVYGIRQGLIVNQVSTGQFYIYGSKFIAHVSLDSKLILEKTLKTKDWIQDVLAVKDGLVVLFAHNFIQKWTLDMEHMMESIDCQDPCQMYFY